MPELPSLLLPAVELPPIDEQTADCAMCHRAKPLREFTCYRVGQWEQRHKTCNQCRARRRSASPSTRRNVELIKQAKSQPCSKCGHAFPLVCMELVPRVPLARPVTQSWHSYSEEKMLHDISQCDVMCENCRRAQLIVLAGEDGPILAIVERAARANAARAQDERTSSTAT